MKVLFFQQERGLYYSVHILFDIIRKHLPGSVKQRVLYFASGLSPVKKARNIQKVSLSEKGDINHIVDDINYAVWFMKKEKTILTIHDLMRVYNSTGLKKKLFIFFWLKLPIARCGVVTAVSHTTRNEILKYANCPPGKVRVIYNCTSPDFVYSPKLFNKQKPVLLQVGVRPNKNLSRLIEAIKGIECKLNIVGKPSGEIIELMAKHNIDFSWKERLNRQDLIQQYVDSDVLVFASLYEGFGLPIIEANAVGRVVVTGNCSAMAEVAGNAACLVDSLGIASIRAGILKVIADDDYREQLIIAGRKNIQRFDANTIADQYVNLYTEIYTKNNLSRRATPVEGVGIA